MHLSAVAIITNQQRLRIGTNLLCPTFDGFTLGPIFSDQFRQVVMRSKRIGYKINVMRQSACLVINSSTVNNFASLFN